MTNQLAVVLGIAVAIGLGADLIWLDGQTTLFLLRRFLELTEWVAFWR
ncbi:hypothetical protein [Shimia sp.]